MSYCGHLSLWVYCTAGNSSLYLSCIAELRQLPLSPWWQLKQSPGQQEKKRNNKSDDWNYNVVFNSHLCAVRCTHQRGPVGVQISYLQRWNKLRTSHYQKIQVEEELKLLVKNLKQKKEKAPKIYIHHALYLMKIW